MAQLTRSPTPTSLLRLGRGYTIAVAASLAALFITFALPPVFDRSPYLLLFGAVMISSWAGGLGPALLAVIIGGIGAEYLTAKPGYPATPDMKLVAQLGVFALVGILISWRVHASETQRNRLLLQLRERVKELTVLHRATRVLQKQRDTRTLLEEFVGLVPEGWRYPEVAAARVSFRDIEVATSNFRATPWMQRAQFHTRAGERGFVEVAYLEGGPPVSAAPFLAEEESLIESLAALLASHFDRLQREEERLALTRAQTARAEAEAANRSKDAFLAMVSHELRRPLTAILGWTRMLREGVTPDIGRGLEIIERSASNQLHLIEELLDVSRITAGQLTVTSSRVDLNEIVARACDTVVPAGMDRDVQIGTRLADSPTIVVGDALRLQQIFGNLLANAVKFTPGGGSITVTVQTAGDSARVQVADTGMGIDPAVLPRIFDPFWKAETPAPPSTTGLGLGLSIVHRLVELHGGTIEAQSEGSGRGTTMTVTLPLATDFVGAVPRLEGPAKASRHLLSKEGGR
jgi:signal transduction histidine kinase